jgi:hypothetical protein
MMGIIQTTTYVYISRSVPVDKEILLKDLYQHLPQHITQEDQRAVAKHIVSRISEADGFEFTFHRSYSLAKRPRGQPSVFAEAIVIEFRCSQRHRRTKYISILPYGRTKNRHARVMLVDCSDSILITFPSASVIASGLAIFDIAIHFNHPPHVGRE